MHAQLAKIPPKAQLHKPQTQLGKRTRNFTYLALVLFSAQQTSLFGLYAYLAKSLGIGLPQLIGSMALGSFLFLFGQPYWAAKGLRWSRERCIFFSQLGQLLALLPLLILPLLPGQMGSSLVLALVIASRVVYGLTASALIPSAQALFAENNSEGTSASYLRSMTAHSLALNLGRLIGPLILLLTLPWSPEASLWLYGVLLGIALLVGPKTGKRSRDAKATLTFAHLWPRAREAQWIFLLALAWASYSALVQSSLAAVIQDVWGHSERETAREVALMTIVAALLTVLLQTWLRRWAKRDKQLQPRTIMLSGGFALFLSALLLQGLASPWLLWLGILTMALGIATLVPSTIAAMNVHYAQRSQEPGESGQAAGNLGVAQTLGFAAGGSLSALGLAFEVKVPYLFALILAAFVAYCVVRIQRQSKPQKGLN